MTLSPETACFQPVSRSQPDLHAGEVHLWKAELDSVPEKMRSTVSADEWVRASRFHFAVDRERYVSTRALVRTILAGYSGEDPARLQFTRGPHGKPALMHPASFLEFNLSHSDDLLLLAVTFARRVGVDVEAMKMEVHYEMLAEHYFTPEDQWALRITPETKRSRKFFELWTRNEARLKVHGSGLGEEARFDAHTAQVTVRSFEPASGYSAALAVEGDAYDMICLQWRN